MPLYKFSKAEGRLYLESRAEPLDRGLSHGLRPREADYGEETVTRRSVISRRTTTMSSTHGSSSDFVHKSHTDHLPLAYSSSYDNSSYKRAKISDIVVGEEPNVSARDVLLRWAKKVTAKYPGVRVTDFTQSWRDGCAFSAIINRNRPDLLEWRTVKSKTVRERLETAFHAAEKVGVTRLLDPEDVDTQEIDEKSIITYVSSLYDVFPEVPARHPLFDAESQALVSEYREVASSLHLWMRERTAYFSSSLPSALPDLAKLAAESSRFKSDQLPPRARDKQKLHHIYRDLQKYFEAVGEVEIEPELHVDIMDRNWNKLLSLHQERDLAIQEEIKKWERLNRLAEKVGREVKRVDGRLDDLEGRLGEEARRLDRLHPLDAKHNIDLLESELRIQEEQIQGLFQDVQALKSGNHHEASNLHKRVNKLHSRWAGLRALLHSKLIARLASVSFPVVEERTVTMQRRTEIETRLVDTNTHFNSLEQAIEWCRTRLKQLEESEFGQEVHVVKSDLAFHQREHKEIEKFQSKVDQHVNAKGNFQGEELSFYMGKLTTLQKLYAELLSVSNKRLSDLETLVDLLQSVANQLTWLQEKQQVEISRDWTDKDLSLQTLNHYYQSLMSELEKREVGVRAVVERGQSVLLGGHRGATAIESVLHNLNANWAHLLQLTLALETHMAVLTVYRQFYQDLAEANKWISNKDEILNTTYSVVEFGLDEGERLLKGMQEMREQLNAKAAVIQELQERAQTVSPIKQRRQPVARPIPVKAVCDYKQQNMSIEKGDTWMLHDNSALTHWRVSDAAGMVDVNIPGAVFLVPPPCRESADAAAALAQAYQRTLALWQRKQLRMRQNMIFATIRVVRSWDLAQFIAMGSEQRNAIRKALNEDADKLIQEGEATDPHLRRLRIEMDEVNKLFDDFERRARQEEETKSLVKQWNDVMQSLDVRLDEFERTLNTRLSNSIPRDVHSLEHMVIQHKDFETSLKGVTPDIEHAQGVFRNIPRKTPQIQSSLDTMLKRWNQLWNSSHIYTERLKCVEMLLNGMDEANTAVSELELKLASFGEMPAELEPLQQVHDELVRVQNALAERQPLVDRLIEDATGTRRTVVRSRDRLNHSHHDLDRMDDDVNHLTSRWNNLCASLLDRLRSCEGSYRLLESYGKTYQTEVKYIDEAYSQLNNVPISKLNVEPTKVLFTSIVERTQPLEQVNIDGGRFIREAKQAMEEKYKLCEETLRQLLEWLSEVEQRLAGQEPVQEDLDMLRNQINLVKLMKEEVESQSRVVSVCLDEVRAVVGSGAEYLSRDEVAALERGGTALRSRYERAAAGTDSLLRRLLACADELAKFGAEAGAFTAWLERARRSTEERERTIPDPQSTRDLVSDVIAHQADLRFITMAANKFFSESKEFVDKLNEYRSGLGSRLGSVSERSESRVRSQVSRLGDEYRELLARANRLADKLTGVGGRQREYSQALDRLRTWLSQAEPQAIKVVNEPIAADPHTMEEQLSRAKALNNEFISQARLVDNLKQAHESLVRSLEGSVSVRELQELEAPVRELEERHARRSAELAQRVGSVEQALAASQGADQALDALTAWVQGAENSLKALSRPASLHKDRLEQHIREVGSLMTEIDGERGRMAKVADQARSAGSNPRLAARLESRCRDLQSRLDKLMERSRKQAEVLSEVHRSLVQFLGDSGELERLGAEVRERLAVAGTGGPQALAEATAQAQAGRDRLDPVLRDARALVSRKDVTDTPPVRDRIKSLEAAWRDLVVQLEERQRAARAAQEAASAAARLREQVLAWLATMETRVSRLEPPALRTEILKNQADELKPLVKEHRDFGPTVDKLVELASGLEESPTHRRRSSLSPTKRRPSQIIGTDDEVAEASKRYSTLGSQLSDRQTLLDSLRDEVKRATDSLRALDTVAEKISRSLPRDAALPQSRDDADKQLKVLRGVAEELRDKQALLDTTKGSVAELLRRHPGGAGADSLRDQLGDVVAKWQALSDLAKTRIQILQDIREVLDTHDNINTWLAAKEKMLGALGPISGEPRVVQSQMQQVQVLREEVRTQEPTLVHLGTLARGVAAALPESPDTHRLTAKVGALSSRYDELARRLEERATALGAAEDSARALGAALARLTDATRAIAARLDAVPRDAEPQQQLYDVLACERQADGLRPLLADAEATGERLASVLADKQEIAGRLTGVRRELEGLVAQISQRRAELEAGMRDARELDEACARTLAWATDSRRALADRLLVSADSAVLQHQLDHHQPIYKEIMSKEHEVIMLLDRGRDSRQLDSVRAAWDKLKREVVERHSRLQTAMEQCKKYYKALEGFIPWLSQAENKLDSLRPDNFTKKDVEKHLRDLANFRNDVWKKSGEFEHMMSLGESFIQMCDVDKEVVKQEMTTVKQRWDKLNNEMGARTSEVEEWVRRLGEFGERQRELAHSLQRCEDRLGAHDAVGATDAASLARLRATAEEAAGLSRSAGAHVESGAALDRVAPCRSALGDEARALAERLAALTGRLDDRCAELLSAQQAAQQFGERLKAASADLAALDAELDAMKPPARELGPLNKQIDQLDAFINKVEGVSAGVRAVAQSANALVDGGTCDASATRVPAAALQRSLAALEERSAARHRALTQALDRLSQFYQLLDTANQYIETAEEEVKEMKAVGSDADSIRSQQAELERLHGALLEPLGRSVDQASRAGQALVQTAASGVSTQQIERDLETLNTRYNSLKEKVSERGRRLDAGLLQSGKLQEALEGLCRWLSDTEEMVANQRPPAPDYNVVKAQLQEQKFLMKMINDREGSVGGLAAMGSEVTGGATAGDRLHIERQIQDVVARFDSLSQGAARRMAALQETISVAKLFQDKLVPVLDWLDRTEKKIKDMELVPTDEEKIQNHIREHSALHNEILRKKTALTELTDVGSQLMSLVGEDEASNVADKVQEIADRYSRLVDGSDGVGQLLESSRSGLRHLVLSYQQLQAWMEGMETRLSRYKVLGVHTDKLVQQMGELAEATEEVSRRQGELDATVDTGLELMQHISSDEALRLKDKLDSLQRRYTALVAASADLLRAAQQALPLVQQFHAAHARLADWMMAAESLLQHAEPSQHDIHRLEQDIHEFRPVLENINQVGPQLCSLSPGEGASTIEGLVTRDNRRFDSIVEQIQRKAERLHLSQQRSLEVLGDMDSLLEWFREVEGGLRDADPPSSDPQVIRLQLKEHRALNDDISSQKGRVRDVLATAKKVLRESNVEGEAGEMRDKMCELREVVESAWGLSGERLSVLEQALALAQHLLDSHSDLAAWLTEVEQQVKHLPLPAIRPQAIAQQQDRTQMLMQSIIEHKPLVDKLSKTGEALVRLVVEEEGARVTELVEADQRRYAALRSALKQRQEALEQALQESSQFSDKLEGMLRALASAKEEVSSAEPVSAHPPKIKQQQNENQALQEDLGKRREAFDAVKRAASDVINKAPNPSDPAVKDVKTKLERLNRLWEEVEEATRRRGRSLDEALAAAARFWTELQGVMATLADLEASLASQPPPAARPPAIERQQRDLADIKTDMEATRPEVEGVRRCGESLMALCGEPDKPEVRKHMEDLDTAWDTVTALFARREENLINAMEKAMEFHETLQDLLEFLKKAENKFSDLGPLGSDIETVKKQINDLKQFKQMVDPYMVKVEALNRQAGELTERTSAEGAAGLRESLQGVNQRWDLLQRGVAERGRQLEHSLLRLGQFQHALAELLAWIQATDQALQRDISIVHGDSHLLEIELAKLKVLVNDIQAHQASVDTLNDAGRQLIESGRGSSEASSTQDKLASLNSQWKQLSQRAAAKHRELEEALHDAHRFGGEVADLVGWLTEVEGVLSSGKPVGGLPETATEQLERFMEVFREVENTRPRVEAALARGQEYLRRPTASPNSHLAASLKTLKQRWDSVTSRANDKKIKLEIALKEATDFHQSLQAFVDWLTSAEKGLGSLKPVSRVLETILQQIEEHKAFQKEVSLHRETMIQLDKKGTHLKYFSQKQDVILIKNLLISVQHRWERVVSKSAERTRALDHGYKEAKEFHDSWSNLMKWLKDTERVLDEAAEDLGSDPHTLKQRLAAHRDTQKALASKQPQYDSTLRAGKALRERAPKSDEAALKGLVAELRERWNAVCGKAVERQRRLEEALLCSGQLRDALDALIDWLTKTSAALRAQPLVHGDLDTVHALIDKHKVVEKEMSERRKQMSSVEKTGAELTSKGGSESQALSSQLSRLDTLWRETSGLVESRGSALQAALASAEQLHKAVHMLLEWLSDAEMKLRFVDSLPDDDVETRSQIAQHEKLLAELKDKERDKASTIGLAESILAKSHPDAVPIIKHWVTIIESRWEEVSSWARARSTRLTEHLTRLQDLDNLLDELLDWLAGVEQGLLDKERQDLPTQIPPLQGLIKEHQEFMETMMSRQSEVDAVCKAKQARPAPAERKPSSAKKMSTPSRDDLRTSSSNLAQVSRKPSLKSSRDNLGILDRKSSRAGIKEFIDSGMTPHFGPRFPVNRSGEIELRSPRARLLWDRWRNVWLLAWERQRRLQQALAHLHELQRLANFSWDEWRKRFLKFMNHKKARITDLFRKMDKNNDNLLPRDDFIDGIIKTKFGTSALEMGAVADMFDHHGEGVIDWKEFVAALRPDWEERQPNTEADKIHDEVKRLVMLCTCRQKFRVFQVGEGKYRFGDSQKLRLVRILRSTVMVRVGGGWVALEEFLVKNDPCRAKGRTNIELREQFILADGVSQSMSAFKPKSSTSSQRASLSSQGPITKVKEKTSKSVPMTKPGSRGTPGSVDSLSDNESPLATPYRRPYRSLNKGGSLPGSRGSSRPASRQGSKPPSLHGSTLSLASSDDGTPSRIPRRSTPGGLSASRTPSQRKTTAPALNGNKSPSPRSQIPRASSIPTLKVNRVSSGALRRGSETKTPSSNTSPDKTPTEPRAPFRL